MNKLKISDKAQSIIYVALCVILWSILPCFAKLGQTKLDNHQFLCLSSIISFAALLGISCWNGSARQLLTCGGKNLLWLSILGFFNYFYYLMLYLGYKEAAAMEVLVIQYTWPIFIVLLSLFILHERLNLSKTAAIFLGFIGVVVIITKGNLNGINLRDIRIIGMVIIGSISFALFSVLSKKVTVNPLNAVTIYFFATAVYSFISMLIYSEPNLPTSFEWISVVINGVLINGISYIFWIKALQKSDASFIAPFIFITPVLSTIQLIMFFDDPFEWIYIFGMALIILSGVLNNFRTRQPGNNSCIITEK